MKTRREIVEKYMIKPQYFLNNCFAFYKELHENGHHDYVLNFLKNGDGFLGQQGFTWNACLKAFCKVESSSFNDDRGIYAGTHYTYFYKGEIVYQSTSYSLFN